MRKIFLFPLAFLFCAVDCPRDYPRGVLTLTSIQVMNVDNSGADPFIVTESATVPAKAYMLGVRWYVNIDYEQSPHPSSSQPVDSSYVFGSALPAKYTCKIYTVGLFNADYPEGADVTQLFRKEGTYLPDSVNVGFLLFGSPDPGFHSFKVVYTGGDRPIEATTPVVELE